jgi:hypothetical protein
MGTVMGSEGDYDASGARVLKEDKFARHNSFCAMELAPKL